MPSLRPPRRAAQAALAAALVLLLAPSALAQGTGTLAGRVTDAATGETLPGANVRVEGTTLGAATDIDGRYRIVGVPAGMHAVTVSFVGYAAQTVPQVVVRPGETRTLDVALDGSAALDEVVVEHARPVIHSDAIGVPRVTSGGRADGAGPDPWGPARRWGDREQYAPVEEVGFRRPTDAPLSTFGVDVDRASYANVRRMLLREGRLPPPDAVRLEEFVNAFDYGLAAPAEADRHPVRVETELAACPWAPEHRLLRVSMQARRVPFDSLPPLNLVFLVDVSGSMNSADKLPLVQEALRRLAGRLRPHDRVALVVYAGASGLVLSPTADRAALLDALGRLQAGGSTAGGAGLELAYRVARQHFDPDAVNRVVLATDGDFNVGPSSDAEMLRLVERERESGVFLSVLGVGTGNIQDAKMELLANRGNGSYSYLDSVEEAERVLVTEAGGTLVAVAKDVKLQVEFNPAAVAGYRLLGYENRALAPEDFADDRRDAGEVGAGQAVTALYEVVPAGGALAGPAVEPLRYQRAARPSRDGGRGELATVRVRYKRTAGGGLFARRSVRFDVPVVDGAAPPVERASAATRWAAAVAEAALVLRASAHAPGATLDGALARARAAVDADPTGERAEFVRLVEAARTLRSEQAARSGAPVGLAD